MIRVSEPADDLGYLDNRLGILDNRCLNSRKAMFITSAYTKLLGAFIYYFTKVANDVNSLESKGKWTFILIDLIISKWKIHF